MTDINLLGFKWCCSGDCGCDGGEHEVSGVATWEGYSRWVYSWVWCLCSSGNYPDEEETHAVNLSLSVPRVIFTNDDGGAEQSDLAPLKMEFSSTQVTNAVILLTHDKDLGAVRIWTDTNKTELVSMPFMWEIKNKSSGVTNLYVEGTHVSKNYQSVNLHLSWREELLGDDKISLDRKTTVYYPIANVINSTLMDNGRLCNPSGIIVGSNACFEVEFPKLVPPAEDIKWSVVEGPAAFVGGNIGSKVYVTATKPNQAVKLCVQVGDSISRPIEFTAFTVEPLSVKLTVWIVGDCEGTYFARGADEVTNMVSEVNRIYEQIGVSFYIDSISYTNSEDWLDIEDEEYDSLRRRKKINRIKMNQLTNLSRNTGGIELYFINKIAGSTLGLNPSTGAIITTNANEYTLAHEIGHSFGLEDVYPRNKYYTNIKLQNSDFEYNDLPDDFSNGSRKRYYEPDLKLEELMSRLLMYGYNTENRGDLSSGHIRGFNGRSYETYVNVGFFSKGMRKLPLHQ